MKKVWKWIIGIVIGLLILITLAGAAFFVRSNFFGYRLISRVEPGWHMRSFEMNPNIKPDRDFRSPNIVPFNRQGLYNRGCGLMNVFGFMPFGNLFGWLFYLGLITLIVLGILWMIRNLRTPFPTVILKCEKCGGQIQPGWKNCPYCGKKL
jgi:hypothetical protein